MPKTPDSESSHRADDSAPVISSRGLLGLEIQAQIVSVCVCRVVFSYSWLVNMSKTPDSESSHRADHLAPVIGSRGILRLEIWAKLVQTTVFGPFWRKSGPCLC